ncbi:MAG TPA: lamin tail domain-containing protein [Kofleriaceae bacterium]|nr:lamin tail domain-containing protein [Kofleriaceae bacterium]
MPRRSFSACSCLLAGWSFLGGCAAGGDGVDGEHADGLAGTTEVSARGADDTLDIANWNVEWLGSTAFGPDDEALQLVNVEDVIGGTDFDIWSLEEVVSRDAFDTLMESLTGYTGILANDPMVEGGSGSYSASEQKPALVFKSDVGSLISARIILSDKAFEFGSRPPLEVRLSVSLGGVTQERVFILLHMKAFGDAESRQRRADAAVALKGFLDETYPSEKVIVLGDWNDDLDASGTRPSPFANFVGDPAHYTFPTRRLTDDGVGTTCSSTNTIDHQMVTNELAADDETGSVEAYELEDQVAGYCDNTSDHFPVLVRYALDGASTGGSVAINEILANEPGADTGGEFVEVVNGGASEVDLSGWEIRDTTDVRHTFDAGTSLAAGKAIVVFAGEDAIPAGLDDAVAASSGSLSLTNGGESVSLRDGSGAVVDSFRYTSALGAADGVSMNRSPDGSEGSFVLHSTLSSLDASPGLRSSGSGF